MSQLNRLGLGVMLYIIIMLLLGMQDDMSLTAYIIFGMIAFVGMTFIFIPKDSKGGSDDV